MKPCPNLLAIDLHTTTFHHQPQGPAAHSLFDVCFDEEDGLPVCRLEDCFARQDETEQQQLLQQREPGLATDAAQHDEASGGSGDVIEPTQLTPASQDSADSKPYVDPAAAAAVAAAAGSYIFESCIPATCLDLLPPDASPWQPHQTQALPPHALLQHHSPGCVQQQQQPAGAQNADCAAGLRVDSIQLAQDQDTVSSQLQQDQQQGQQLLQSLQHQKQQQQPAQPQPLDARQHLHHQKQQQHLQPLPVRCGGDAQGGAAGEHVDSHVAPKPANAAAEGQAASSAAAAATSNKGRLSLLPVRRDVQQVQQQQQQLPPAASTTHQPSDMHHQQVYGAQQQQQQQPWQLHRQPDAGNAPPEPGCHLQQWQQPPACVPLPTAWQAPAVAAGVYQQQAAVLSHQQCPQHQQHHQPQHLLVPGAQAAGAPGRRHAPTPAARAYRQQKPFKAPQRAAAATSLLPASASAGPSTHGAPQGQCAAVGRLPGSAGGLLSRPPGSFKAPSKQQQPSCTAQAAAAPVAAAAAALQADAPEAVAGGGFVTGRGGGIAVSAAARAKAVALLQEELGDLGAAGEAVVVAVDETAAAASAAVQEQPPAVSGLGFTTGRGGSIAVSAAARAKAVALLQEELGDLGAAGEAVVAAADESAAAASAAVQEQPPAVSGLGFTTGRGGSIAVSAAARAKAAALLQEELGDLGAAGEQPDAAALPAALLTKADTGGLALGRGAVMGCGLAVLPGQPAAQPAPGGISGVAAGGFVTGRGSNIAVSAAAQARAAALLREELEPAADGADTHNHGSTVAAAAGGTADLQQAHMRAAAAAAAAAAPTAVPLGASLQSTPSPSCGGAAAAQLPQSHQQGAAAEASVAAKLPDPAPSAGAAAGGDAAVRSRATSKGAFKAPRRIDPPAQPPTAVAGAAAAPGLQQQPQHKQQLPQQRFAFHSRGAAVGSVAAGAGGSASAATDVAAAGEVFDASLASDELAYIDRLVMEAEQHMLAAKATAAREAAREAAVAHVTGPLASGEGKPAAVHSQRQQQQDEGQSHRLLPDATEQLAGPAGSGAPAGCVHAGGGDHQGVIIADSQPESDEDDTPLQPTWAIQQPHQSQSGAVAVADAQQPATLPPAAAGTHAAAGDGGTQSTTAPHGSCSAAATAAAAAGGPAHVAAQPHSISPASDARPSAQLLPVVGGNLVPATTIAGLPGRTMWASGSWPNRGTAEAQAAYYTAGAAAAAVPLRGVQWASGDGVAVSRSALEQGEVFAAKLLSLQLLPPWQQPLLLAEVVVLPDGSVKLLLEVRKARRPPKKQRHQQQQRRQEAGAATASHAGAAGKQRAGANIPSAHKQPPPQQLHQQQGQQRRQQQPSSHQPQRSSAFQRRPSLGGSSSTGSRAAGRPPTYGAGGGRQQQQGSQVPKRGSLQALWGAAAGKLPGSKRGPQDAEGLLSTAPAADSAAQQRPPGTRGVEQLGGSGKADTLCGSKRASPEAQGPGGMAVGAAVSEPSVPPAGPSTGANEQHQQPPNKRQAADVAQQASQQWQQPPPPPQQQRPGTGLDAAAGGPVPFASSSGLATAGGRQVSVSAAARQQLQQMLAGVVQHQVVPQHQGADSNSAAAAAAAQCATMAAATAMQQQPNVFLGQNEPQQNDMQQGVQQQQQAVNAPVPNECTVIEHTQAGVSAECGQEGQQAQLQGDQGQQLQRDGVQDSPVATATSAAATAQPWRVVQPQDQDAVAPEGLMTAGGRQVEVSAEAQQRIRQLVGQVQQQQQCQQQCQREAAASSGLSTAGGRQVEVSAEAQQRIRQLVGQVQQLDNQDAAAPQQPQCAAQATPSKKPACSGSSCVVSPVVTTPGVPHTPASASAATAAASTAAATGARPSPACGSAFKTPGLPPRLTSRKRSLSHPHTPGLQQQQGEGGAAGPPGTSVRKAFRPPAIISPAPSNSRSVGVGAQDQQQQQQGGHTPGSSNKKQRVQQEPVVKGLPLSDYFALARTHPQQKQQQQSTGDTAAAAAGSADAPFGLVWIAECLPVNPKESAVFAFKAAAAAADGGSAGQLQSGELKQASAATAAAAAAPESVAVPAAVERGSVFRAAEARAALLQWGADPDKASAAWVANHFKWVVWKLAAYDRKLMGADGSGGSAGRCLRAGSVMQQLQQRYTREVKEGQRSVLKKILEQDLPAGVPLVLLVSEIRTRTAVAGTSNQAGNQQQAAAAASAAAPGRCDDAEVLGMQLSDGWYYVNTMIDGPLAALITSGKLQVGQKVRVVGAELRSDRAAEPLEAARTALLRVSFNGVSPAPWDAKLGPVPGETLRPLTQVHPSGGLVPRLLLLVQRRYPLQYWSRSLKQYVTPKALAQAQQHAERQQEQAMHAASNAAMQEELQQCRQWSASRLASPVERAYAAAVLQAEGGGCAGDACGSSSGGGGGVSSLEVQAFRVSRQNHLEARKQHYMQQEMQRAQAATATSGGGGQRVTTASMVVSLSDPPTPVMYLRVVGAVPRGGGAPCYGEALVKVWRPCEAVQQLDEGALVVATGLSAGTDGRSSTVEGRGRMLELCSGKMTSWRLLGSNDSLSASVDVPPWQPRAAMKLQQLTSAHMHKEMDFNGVLVWAGDVNKDGRDWTQWVFLTDESAAGAEQATSAGEAGWIQGRAQGGRSPASACPVLAICLVGGPTAVDWLPPSAPAAVPSAAPVAAASSSNSRLVVRTEPRQQLSFVAATNVVLQSYDAARGLWVADAHSYMAGVHVVSGSDMRVRDLSAWARQNPAVLDVCKSKVQQVVGA